MIFADVNLACGKTITVSFTEPTLNEDGSPLIDLFATIVFYKIRINQGERTEAGSKTVLASKVTGGGFQTFDIVVDTPEGDEAIVTTITVRCRDISGNHSERVMLRDFFKM